MTVRDIDHGAKRLVERLRQLGAMRVTVGVHEADGRAQHPGSGTSVASVALALEYGTPARPPLAWLRQTVDAARNSYLGPALVKAGAAILRGAEPVVALRPALQRLVDDARALVPSRTGTVNDAITGAVNGQRVTQ